MSIDEKVNKTLKMGKIILWIGIPVIILSPIILTQYSGYFDFTDTGNIGDTIGGITAPFINVISAILIFLALKAQIQANMIVQVQINKQIIDKEQDMESKQMKQYYSNLKNNIDTFKYSTLKMSEIGAENKIHLQGSEAIYKMLEDFIVDYRDPKIEIDITSNPKITEFISILKICNRLLDKIRNSEIPDKEMHWILTTHQYLYRVFPRLSLEYPEYNHKHYAEGFKSKHDLPELITGLVKSIYEKISKGLA